MSDLFEKVKEIIVKQLNVENSNVTEDASFVDDLGADSIDSVELIMAFEMEFNIEISEEDAELLHTVKDIVKYISEKI